MNAQTVRNLMSELKLKGMLKEYEVQLDGGFPDMTFDERLAMLLQAQCDLKRSNSIASMNAKAKFSQPGACIEDIDYSEDRGLDKRLILELASCSYVRNNQNVLVLGASDCGKTYMGCALGNAACRHQLKTRYVRLADMFKDLEQAALNGDYIKKFNEYAKVKVLILDDFLVSIPTIEQVQTLLELVERREYSGSTIVCTLLHPSDWQARIDEKIQANSIYSRLVPNSQWIEIKGDVPMRERIMRARRNISRQA